MLNSVLLFLLHAAYLNAGRICVYQSGTEANETRGYGVMRTQSISCTSIV
jgi:hypothetical protein